MPKLNKGGKFIYTKEIYDNDLFDCQQGKIDCLKDIGKTFTVRGVLTDSNRWPDGSSKVSNGEFYHTEEGGKKHPNTISGEISGRWIFSVDLIDKFL